MDLSLNPDVSSLGARAAKSGRHVVLLCWDSDVYLYAETMRFMAWKLRQDGFHVTRFGCASALQACISITSGGLTADREATCRRCRSAQTRIDADVVFNVLDEDRELPSDAERFFGIVRTSILHQGNVGGVLELAYAGIALCRIAFFDFAISTKLTPESTLNDESVKKYLSGVRDLLILLRAFQRMSVDNDPDMLVFINGNYSQHTLARAYFGARRVACFSVEPQLTSQHVLNRIMLTPERLALHPEGLFPRPKAEEPITSINLFDVRALLEAFGARIRGADFNAYTSLDPSGGAANDLRDLDVFVRAHARVHAFFLSSEDELTPHVVTHKVASGVDQGLGAYRSQFEFTAWLIREAARHPDIGFVIRLHPRMAANKRDNFEAPEHVRYRNLLATSHVWPNVKVLYGDSTVSSYYVIARSDMVIVSWSTIGLEALLLGTPVVSAFPRYLMYPLDSFSRQPEGIAEFERAVFSSSDYGVARDDRLLLWMCNAYEGQFFSTAAPRTRGGLWGKMYRIFYRATGSRFFYGILAKLINLVFLRRVEFSPGRISCKGGFRESFLKIGMHLPLWLLRRYRKRNRTRLDKYGRAVIAFTKS